MIGIVKEKLCSRYRNVKEIGKIHDKWFTINEELRTQIVNELLWVATNSPSKQHEGYYDVYYTADRKVIEEISKYTWGYTHRRNPSATWRNSQANASVYFLFVAKEPNSQLNCNADGTLKVNSDKNRWQNAYCSIGIAIGLTMRARTKMGFETGCNKSHNDLNGDDFDQKVRYYGRSCNAQKKYVMV